ncbi:MAG: ferritin-like domain-containing protein [Nannocystaceae bacterium]
MARLDLRRQAAALAPRLAALDLAALDARDRAAAIATWRGRMVNEHVSARVFAGLVPQLMRAEVDADLHEEVAAMIADELRHARLCAAAVHALGGEAIAELPPITAIPEHEDATPIEAVLRNVISIGCLSETVAVALIDGERLRTPDPELSTLLAEILADEVQHARFGWRFLEALAPGLDAATRSRIDAYLEVAFAHLIEHELAHLPARPAPSSAAEEIGVCDGNEARGLFFDTLRSVIVPGLTAHGFQAQDALRRAMA